MAIFVVYIEGKKVEVEAKGIFGAVDKVVEDNPKFRGKFEVYPNNGGGGNLILVRSDGTWVDYIG